MSGERVLVTGGQGFFGVWITKQLLEEGATPIIFDLKEINGIYDQVLSHDQVERLERHYGNVADLDTMVALLKTTKPTSVIHLAGLQIPTCKANPVLGAQVNVIGTINVFEAVRIYATEAQVPPPVIVYASSAAVLGPKADYTETPVPDDYYHKPRSMYGVFKQCNEGTARIYFQDHAIRSVGLRPYTCFGVGREIGLTSGPTKAIKAAILGRPYNIAFTSSTGFSYIEDVARIFIGCTRANVENAHVFNIRGFVDTVENYIDLLKEEVPEARELVTCSGNELTIMADVDESGLQRLLDTCPPPFDIKKPFPLPLRECIKRTAAQFRKLHAEGRLNDGDL